MFGTQTIRYASNTKGKWPQWMVLGDGSVCLDVLCSFPQGTYRLGGGGGGVGVKGRRR